MSELERWEPVARTYDPLKAGSIDGTDTIPHDHGVVRAMEAEYKPNRLVVGDPKATVFVGQLNPVTTENTLAKSFSKYGKIKKIRLIRDIVTGFSKRYAFIEYSDKYDAMEAIKKMNKRIIDDCEVFVDAECERLLPGWVPRRLGGGLSGKKESGQLRFGGIERPFRKPLIPYRSREDKHEPGGHSRDSFSNRNPYNSFRNRNSQQSDFHNRNRERDRRTDNYSFKRKDDTRDNYRNQ